MSGFDGKLIIFSAPSGSGKTTLVKYLLERNLPMEFSVSACTRAVRPGEEHGKDYYFMTVAEFRGHIQKGDFVEWEEVYDQHYYGTLRSEIDRIWKKKRHVVFDVDVKGGLAIKEKFGHRALSIFVQPPSVEELGRRLRSRGTDSAEEIDRRLNKAAYELSFGPRFDAIIVNDKLENACEEVYDVVRRFMGVC